MTAAKLFQRPTLRLSQAALVVALAFSASAYAQAPFGIEGRIDSISESAGAKSISVMGVTVEIVSDTDPNTVDTTFSSPTEPQLTWAQLSNTAKLPGRSDNGFVGGTAIINGTVTATGIVASTVFVEPAENVVIGTIDTQGSCDNTTKLPVGMVLNGLPLVFLQDAAPAGDDPAKYSRMEFMGAVNANGLAIDPCTARGAAAIEGYYVPDNQLTPEANDRTFFTFSLEAEEGQTLAQFVTSVDSAQCRTGRQYDIRGFTNTPDPVLVNVYAGENRDPDTQTNLTFIGSATVVADGLGGGTYRVRSAAPTCASGVVAIHSGNKSWGWSAVVVR